ncbi:MAG: tetratricopeptide repeat protein, partial [Sneathiella sp.]|nr:tetratricopeptide repeat protein [Sneathiella sp.]
MLQIKDILNANKMMLLLTTSLVVAGCTTVDQQNYGSDDIDQAPIAVSSPEQDAGDLSTIRLMRMAQKSWAKGDAATAMRLYAMANQKSPNNPKPLLGAAEILRKTKRTPEALELYKKIIAKQPDLIAAHAGIGYTYLVEDKPYLAAKSFEHAVSLDNQNSKSLGGLALALDTAGEHGKAQDYYRLAIKSDPNNLTYQNNLALSLALIGRIEQAIAMLEIITAHPNATAQHRQNLALVYGMAGKSSDAMRYSRMDLNESEARNNALYFQALNQPIQEEQIAAQEQVNIMVAEANAREKVRTVDTSRQ